MAKDKKRTPNQGVRKPSKKEPETVEQKRPSAVDIFTPTRLIVMFLIIEALIIILMKDDYIISHHRSSAQNAARTKNYDKAIYHYQKLFKIAPDSATVNLEMANVYFDKRDYEHAITHYRRVLEIDPTIKGVNSRLGQAYLEKSDSKTALEYFKGELELNRRDPYANFYIGEDYFKKGDYQQAAQHFQVIVHDRRFETRLKEYWKEIEEKFLRDTADVERSGQEQ